MLYAVRGNKQLRIDEAQKSNYLALGYDIAKEEDGKLVPVEESPSKKVTLAQYKAALEEISNLKEQLKAAGDPGQVEALQKENKSLKDKLAEANKKLKEATQQSG